MASFGAAFGFPLGGDPDMLIPVELYDPVPGNRGLRGPATMLFHFEEPDGVLVSDASGNLEDLVSQGATSSPPILVPTWAGRGRFFDGEDTGGLIAADRAGRDTLLQRDMTVQAILSFGPAEVGGGIGTIIARGIDDGTAAERVSYRLVMERDGANAAVWWTWQNSSGAVIEEAAGEFQLLSPSPADKLFLLTATRRWEAADKVVVRYYVDERMIGEFTSDHGDIAGGTTGHTTIGATKSGGTWDDFFSGALDELAVYDYEMSPEEVRAVWRRLYEHQPGGVETLRGLIPPGAPWMKDPSNKIGRRMKVVGQALGGAAAVADELRELFLPDQAPRDQLARWEAIYGVSARPRDSLNTRRARLLGITGREEGFSRAAVKEALLELLDVVAPEDLEIVEGQNVIEDSFTAIADERWLRGDLGTWSIVASQLRIIVPIASDIRWETQRFGAHLRTSLDTGGTGPGFVQAKISSVALPNDSGAGILLADRRRNAGIWFGFYRTGGGVLTLRYLIRNPGEVFEQATLATGPIPPLTLRIVAGETPGTFTLSWSIDGVTWDPGDTALISTPVTDHDWGGFAVWGDASSTASQITVDFDDWLSWCPNGLRPHYWYVYRNPAIGGSPDIIGAQRLIDRLKPAHTHAAVIQSKSLLAGNERDGLAGRNPMGVLHSP